MPQEYIVRLGDLLQAHASLTLQSPHIYPLSARLLRSLRNLPAYSNPLRQSSLLLANRRPQAALRFQKPRMKWIAYGERLEHLTTGLFV